MIPTVAALPAPQMQFPPVELLSIAPAAISLGWRIPMHCYPSPPAPTPCGSTAWFYVLLGAAVLFGAGGKRR